MFSNRSISFLNKFCLNIFYGTKMQISKSKLFINKPNVKRFCTNGAAGQKVEVDGMKIYYEKVGRGKQTIFLMPGALGSTRTDFTPQLDGLDRNKFTLIAWDPPGYGCSRPPKRNFTGNFYFTDAIVASHFMKNLGYTRYSVLGWSDGGITGMILAALNPQTIQHLVIWGASAYVTPSDIQYLESIKDVSKWSDKMRASFEAIYQEDFSSLWREYVEAVVNNFKEDEGRICSEVLADIHCPTLVLHGDKDPLVNLEHPLFLQKNIKNCSVHRFAEGKHNIHLRYASEFNNLVQNFLLNN